MKKCVIKWTNKYSNEEGFVREIKLKEGYFVNTFNIDEAKLYTENNAKGMITLLSKTKESINNIFSIVYINQSKNNIYSKF